MFNSKTFLVEFIGTFAIVFIGAGAAVVGAGIVGVALACGFTLAVFTYSYGHISGAHLNPAVTFGLALNGTVKWLQTVVYWVAQFAGAAAAAALLHYAVTPVGGSLNPAATVGVLTESQPIWAMVIEIVLTFFLVNTILQTAVAGRGGDMAGWAIGTTFAFSILAGSALTGASLNPARTFGPAIFAGPNLANVYTYVIYLFGPLIGATLAVMAFNFFNGMDEEDEVEHPASAVEKVPVKAVRKPIARKTTKAVKTARK
ncbi:MAG: aquaporin [Anaerolineales bacterium]|nr:MAG: aquaporin [Anaerolineales bacterium]